MSLENIKLLREKTGAGMVECQKALKETNGDIEAAVEILRKKGIAKAAKRSGRETAEGVIKIAVKDDYSVGYMIEVNAETDFVARNEKFQNFVDNVLAIIKAHEPQDLAELNSLSMDNGTVKETLDNLSGTIGEKMAIKRFQILKSKEGTVNGYSHMQGRIGVLVTIDKANEPELAREIAMQVAAANPRYIKPEDVPTDEIDKEKEIYHEQLKKEGKPENIIDKILQGKINKYFEEICLLNQDYIKEEKKKVADILNGVKVIKFIRYSL